MHAPKERKSEAWRPSLRGRHGKPSDEGWATVRSAPQCARATPRAQLNGSTHHPNETAFSMGLLASQQLQCGDGLLGPLTHSRR